MMTAIITASYLSTINMITQAKMVKNPVKMCLFLLLTSMIMMFDYYNKKSCTWFAWSFVLMFLGGILIMFLILSSLMPNSTPGKSPSNNYWWLMIPLVAPIMSGSADHQVLEGTKWFLSSGMNFVATMVILMLYFLGFLSTLKNNKNCMRTKIMSCRY